MSITAIPAERNLKKWYASPRQSYHSPAQTARAPTQNDNYPGSPPSAATPAPPGAVALHRGPSVEPSSPWTAAQSIHSTPLTTPIKAMLYENENTKQDLLKRMRRIEGQTRGVQSMIENDRECSEILQQLTALRSAIQSASLFLLKQYAAACIQNIEGTDSEQKREQLLENLITLLGKAS